MDTHCTVNSNRSQNLYWSLLFQQLFICLFYINSKFATTGVLFSAISPLLTLNIFSMEIWRTVWKQKQWKWAASLSNDDFDKERKVLSPNALTFCFTFWCICCRLTRMPKKETAWNGQVRYLHWKRNFKLSYETSVPIQAILFLESWWTLFMLSASDELSNG